MDSKVLLVSVGSVDGDGDERWIGNDWRYGDAQEGWAVGVELERGQGRIRSGWGRGTRAVVV